MPAAVRLRRAMGRGASLRGCAVITRAEALRLARVSRQMYGMRREPSTVDGSRVSLACPLDVKHHPYRRAHRIIVWHKHWERVTAPMIGAAFVEHYRSEYPEERCPALAQEGVR